MLEPIQSTTGAVSLMMLAIAAFGPLAGPYVVIILGATGGALWALSSAELATRWQGAWLMLRCVITAVVLTAFLAKLASDYAHVDVTEAYSWVSFAIGALGNRWLDIIESIKVRIQGAITTGGRP
nr:hypothetical protein [uncultured Rhodoferax sp.]